MAKGETFTVLGAERLGCEVAFAIESETLSQVGGDH